MRERRGHRHSRARARRSGVCGAIADVVVADAGGTWYTFPTGALTITEQQSVDPTRPATRVEGVAADVIGAQELAITGRHACASSRRWSFAAEAIGVAQWCVETAAEYAKARVQFGRPIGQFQGVKHRCADMLARVELARAAVWDATARSKPGTTTERRSPSRRVPRSRSMPLANGKDCIQTLGGIGFTWEHDTHVYLRRAMTLHQLVGTPDE